MDEYAYPLPETETTYTQHGMTLRDWFAGQASENDIKLHMYACNGRHKTDCNDEQARYRYADAMMEARKK